MSHHVIVARSLRSELRFICPDADIARHLAYVEATPEMVGIELDPIEIRIIDLGGGFYDFGDHRYAGTPGTARHIVERAHTIIREQVAAETPGQPVLHAASLIIEGRRCLITAEKGSGKTTLMLEALRRGISVEGDEHVTVDTDHVIARPRSLRIKAGSLDFAEEFREHILASPSIKDWNDSPIYSLPPRTDRVDWRITPGPADVIVRLQPNHNALTCVAPMSWEQSFASLLDNAFLPESGRGPALGKLQRLATATKAWNMRIGDLERAFWHLRQICGRL